MKKLIMTIAAGVLAISLTACNETAEPTEGASEANKSELTAKEVYSKALEVSEEMESAELSMDLKQRIESEADSTALDTESSFDMKMTMDPLAFHQKGTTKMAMGGESQPGTDIEMYMVEDGMYIYNGQAGSWMKMDSSMMDALNSMAGQQQSPSEQLKMLEEYAEEFSFEQSDSEFILKLSADGDKFNELIQKTMEESFPPEMMQAMGEEGQKALEDMEINSMSYELSVDKETFEMTSFNMDMDMAMGPEGNAINIVQNMTSEYSNINKVDPIKVPEDVKNNAIEQPLN